MERTRGENLLSRAGAHFAERRSAPERPSYRYVKSPDPITCAEDTGAPGAREYTGLRESLIFWQKSRTRWLIVVIARAFLKPCRS